MSTTYSFTIICDACGPVTTAGYWSGEYRLCSEHYRLYDRYKKAAAVIRELQPFIRRLRGKRR